MVMPEEERRLSQFKFEHDGLAGRVRNDVDTCVEHTVKAAGDRSERCVSNRALGRR